jgi:uncharacterized protein (UPF0261 family)
MSPVIAVLGALDTKGPEFEFLRNEIEYRGCRALMIDVGVLGAPLFQPDITQEQVAEAGGANLEELRRKHNRAEAMGAMARGAAVIARQLHAEGRIHGLVAMGGSGGTLVGTSAMRALPLGFPKLMVSTSASGDVSAYVGVSDIAMLAPVVDIAGLNNITRAVFANAASAICGMACGPSPKHDPRPTVALTMIGNTTPAAEHARSLLEARGYSVVSFHANGGGRALESLVAAGQVAAVLDLTLTEWANELCGGVRSAGSGRLEAAARAGIPQVVAPGGIDICNFWGPDTVPQRYQGRQFCAWSPEVTLMRTTPEENTQLGEIVAGKLNAATGPVSVHIPHGGFSQLGAEGGPFWWPAADAAFMAALRAHLRRDIAIVERPSNINDADFAFAAAAALDAMLTAQAVK